MKPRSEVLTTILTLGIGFFGAGCPKAGAQIQTDEPLALPTGTLDAPASAQAALARAEAAQDARGRKSTAATLRDIYRAYPNTDAGQRALYRAGVLAFEDGEHAAAKEDFATLLFANPLFPQGDDARLKMALSTLRMKAYREAYLALSTLTDRFVGAQRAQVLQALQEAAAGAQQHGASLQAALDRVAAAGDTERAPAQRALEDVLDGQANLLTVAEVWNTLPRSHPGWPAVTMKLVKVYQHLREWTRLQEMVAALRADAPTSSYAVEAQALALKIEQRQHVQPKLIGALLPMTGKYKALGEAVSRGIQLALHGSGVSVVVKDTQSDASTVGTLVEDLVVNHGAMAIVGPLLPDDSRRAALAAEEIQVPLITLTPAEGVTSLGAHIFRNMVTNVQQAEALAEYAVTDQGFKSVAMLFPNLPFGAEMADAFWNAVERRGAVVRGAESYNHDQTTFSGEVKKLVGRYYLEDRGDYLEKVRELRADSSLDAFRRRKAIERMSGQLEPVVDFDALLIADSWQRVGLIAPALAVEDVITNACDKKDLERIRKTTKRDKIRSVTLLGPSTWSSTVGSSGSLQLVERGGKFVQCSVYVDGFYAGSERPATKAFVAAFREAYPSTQPTLLDAVGHDSAAMLRHIIEKNKPATRLDVLTALGALRDFPGATGSTSFDDHREAVRPLFLLRIDPHDGVQEVVPTRSPRNG